jgi:hypothetical protein
MKPRRVQHLSMLPDFSQPLGDESKNDQTCLKGPRQVWLLWPLLHVLWLLGHIINWIFFSHCTALGAKVYMTTELLLHLPWFLGITNKYYCTTPRIVLHLSMLSHFPQPLGHESKNDQTCLKGPRHVWLLWLLVHLPWLLGYINNWIYLFFSLYCT